jgi:hypothetical protein
LGGENAVRTTEDVLKITTVGTVCTAYYNKTTAGTAGTEDTFNNGTQRHTEEKPIK